MDIVKHLFELRDEKFHDFNIKLIPNTEKETVIGIRTPQLKPLATTAYIRVCLRD